MTEPSFEELMQKLEDLVRRLESGDQPLEQSLAAYQDGMELVKQARARLEAYELKVEKVLSAGGDTEPFDPEE
jgi:exodeoxyribonuclease VII small subunit